MTDMRPTGVKAPRLHELDGLRGLLALWVAFSHILAWTGHWENPLPDRASGAWSLIVGAGPAVDTFIILSGFAISFLIHRRRQGWLGFMRGRVFRIYPVYLACLALAVATGFLIPGILASATWRGTEYFSWLRMGTDWENSAFGRHLFWHVTLLNGLLPKNILPGASGTLLPPAWSITLEWQYYLAAPLLARGVRSSLGLLAIALVAWFGVSHAAPWQNPQLAFLPAQLPLFLVGIASYHLHASLADRTESPSVSCIWPLALAMAGILTGWHAVALTVWSLGFGGILVRVDDPAGKAFAGIRRGLAHSWLRHLGRISFPIYLVHWPVIIAVLSVVLRARPDISSHAALALVTAIALPATLLAAHWIHHGIEKPLMDLGRKLDRWPNKEVTTDNPAVRGVAGN